jgi:hypothetical protein
LQVRSRNNPKSFTYIFKSPKQGRSCLTKISLQTDSDQRKVRAYIPVIETRQIIDVYKKSSSPEGVHLLAIGIHHCILPLHESFKICITYLRHIIFPRCHVSRIRSNFGPSHDVVRFCTMIVRIPTIPEIAAWFFSMSKKQDVVRRPKITPSTGVRVFLRLPLPFVLSQDIKWDRTIWCDIVRGRTTIARPNQ